MYFDHIACSFFNQICFFSYHLGKLNVVVRAENSFSSMEMDGGNTTVNCYNQTVNQHEGDTVCDPESVYKHTSSIISIHLIHLCEMLLTTENVIPEHTYHIKVKY